MTGRPIILVNHEVEWGGAETVLADLMRHVDRDRWPLMLACHGPGPLAEAAQDLGIPVHAIPMAFGNRLRKALAIPGAARRLATLARETGALALHANSMIAGYASVLAAPRCGIPSLWHVHNIPSAAVARRAIRKADRVVAPSHAIATACESVDVEVVRNGLGPRWFDAPTTHHGLRAELGIPERAPLAVIIGRIDPAKGHADALEAMARQTSNVHLVVVGDVTFGRHKNHLETLQRRAAFLEIAERVHFVGMRSDVREILHLADVALVPSREPEGLPRAIAEAQATRTAVIASEIGGISEMIESGVNGLLVPAARADRLADAMEQVVREDHLRERLAAGGQSRARRDYGVTAFVERIQSLWAELVKPAAITR